MPRKSGVSIRGRRRQASVGSPHNAEYPETLFRSRKELPMGHEPQDHSSRMIPSTRGSGNGNSPSLIPVTQVKQRSSYGMRRRCGRASRDARRTARIAVRMQIVQSHASLPKAPSGETKHHLARPTDSPCMHMQKTMRNPRPYGVVQQGLCDYAASLDDVVLPRHCRYHRQNHNERTRQSRLLRRRHHHPHGHTYGILVTIIVIICTMLSISGD